MQGIPLSVAMVPRLGYPGGVYRRQGFDPTHPAARTLSVNNGLSGIASGGNFISLVSSARYTLSAPQTARIVPTGAGLLFDANVSNFCQAETQAGGTPAAMTIAAIVFITSSSANFPIVLACDAVAPSLSIPNGALRWFNGGTATLSSVTLGNGPYFIAMSAGSAATNFLALNLATGGIQTQSAAGNAPSAFSSSVNVGGTSINSFGFSVGYISAVMMARSFMSLSQLLAWAADPWGFWYQPIKSMMLVGQAAAGGFKPWFARANYINGRLAA